MLNFYDGRKQFEVKHTDLSTLLILVVLICIESLSWSWTGWYEDGGDYIGDFHTQEEGKNESSYSGALTRTACLEDGQRFLLVEDYSSYMVHLR